ncbi:MAG: hypothetical protein EAZ97_10430 [Bacteroidetes bacterium]|nr:MAG: hypothetical protein EAZ97_10430 [Bacteroidota bacterium]
MNLPNLLESLSGFIEANLQLVKLEVKDGVSKLVVALVTFIMALFCLTIVLLFANISLSFFISQYFKWGYAAGFGVVALLNLSLFLLFLLLRKRFKFAVESKVDKALPMNIKLLEENKTKK